MVTGPAEAEAAGLVDVDALDDVSALDEVTGAAELLLGEATLGAAEEADMLIASAVGTLAVPLASAGFSVVD